MFGYMFSVIAAGLLLGTGTPDKKPADCCKAAMSCCAPAQACCVAVSSCGIEGCPFCTHAEDCCEAGAACCIQGQACCRQGKKNGSTTAKACGGQDCASCSGRE